MIADDENSRMDEFLKSMRGQPLTKKLRAWAVLFGVWMAAGIATGIVLLFLEKLAGA